MPGAHLDRAAPLGGVSIVTARLSALAQPASIPLLALLASAVCVLLLDLGRAPRRLMAALSLTGLIIAAAMAVIVVTSGQGGSIQGIMSLDGSSALFVLFFCGAGAACLLTEQGMPAALGMQDASGYALLLLAASGSTIVAQSNHWIPIIIGMAVLHVSLAALIGSQSAWLYVLVQGLSQALTLFGAVLLYGATGTMQTSGLLDVLARSVPQGTANSLAVLGTGLVIAGVCMPMVIAPFHIWLRRACRHVWVPAGPMLSLALPATAIAALVHVRHTWTATSDLLALLGSMSVALGYVDALRSRSLPGALAGVTVAQSGCLLLAWVAVPDSGWVPPFYLMGSSGLAIVSLWALVASVQSEANREPAVDDLAGLGQRHPWLGAAATLSLLSIAALPPLAGSIALLAFLRSTASAYSGAVGMVLAGIGVAWLLAGRWIWTMWMRPPTDRQWARPTPELLLLAVLSAGGLVLAGICGEMLMRWIAGLSAIV